MRPLSVAILSDLHLDMHFKAFRQTKAYVKEFFDPIFMPEGKEAADVLVLAGDIGHYNEENEKIIGWLRELYFKNIICVLGNHDYYLINSRLVNKFDADSYKRAQAMRDALNAMDGVYCLNGNVVEIDGIRFGGCDSWYDGQYLLHNLNFGKGASLDTVRILWRHVMNDAAYIPNLKLFDVLWEIERPKIEATYKECDVMITHVSPSIVPEHIPEKHYREDDSTAFFTFNGEKYVEETTAKVWIYGHTHTPNEYEWHGVRMIVNPLGYPGENRAVKEKRIEIRKKVSTF